MGPSGRGWVDGTRRRAPAACTRRPPRTARPGWPSSESRVASWSSASGCLLPHRVRFASQGLRFGLASGQGLSDREGDRLLDWRELRRAAMSMLRPSAHGGIGQGSPTCDSRVRPMARSSGRRSLSKGGDGERVESSDDAAGVASRPEWFAAAPTANEHADSEDRGCCCEHYVYTADRHLLDN